MEFKRIGKLLLSLKKIGHAYTKHVPNCLINLTTFVIFNQSKRVFGWRECLRIFLRAARHIKSPPHSHYILTYLVFTPTKSCMRIHTNKELHANKGRLVRSLVEQREREIRFRNQDYPTK